MEDCMKRHADERNISYNVLSYLFHPISLFVQNKGYLFRILDFSTSFNKPSFHLFVC